MTDEPTFRDFVPAPNIGRHPELYERENEAIARDGRLDAALLELADWSGKRLLDIGCGTGFWLPRYAEQATRVVGVEPDPALVERARERCADLENVAVMAGSAEHLPLDDDSVDIAHARFAYFFGARSAPGLAEVARVLRPGGVFVVVDNSWEEGDFARLLEIATEGNAAMDPDAARRWWGEQGAERTEVLGGWHAASAEELERILRIEFAADVVDRFWAEHHDGGPSITYAFALYRWVS